MVAVLLLYGGAAWAFSAKVPGGTTVAGVDVGGLSEPAAARKLTAAFAGLDGSLPVKIGSASAELDLTEAGLTLDAEATARSLAGFSLNPATLWRHVAGAGAQPAVPAVPAARLDAALAALGGEAGRPAADASITFVKGRAVLRNAAPGTALDRPAAAAAVRRGWLGGGPLTLPTTSAEPEITQAEGEAALEDVARPAVSGPLTLRVGSRDVSVPAAVFAPALRMAAKGGRLDLVVDGKKLAAAVLAAQPSLGTAPKDARIELRGGKPVVVPGVAGVTLDAAALTAAVRPALTDPARTASVRMAVEEPDLTTAEARGLGVKERISTFSTNLTANPRRTENLRVAARTVDGTLVRPGETFSLNGVLGERTPQKGYNQAPAISGGRLVNDYGGGVSQMATTIYNNVFFSGLEVIHHKPHSFYISRYPEGREATVNYPTVDLKWRNDSSTAVLISASVGSQVTVSFYGTKTWDITASKSARTNLRTPGEVYDDTPGCVAQSANGGFDVSVTRTFHRPGASAVVKRETFRTTYIAEDRVVCGPKPR
jgi:vancomycin resistance protein YoaR